MKNNFFSVVICAISSKRANDLLEVFTSIKNQTYKNYELIFVSDGNKELANIAKEYFKKIKITKVKLILNNSTNGLSYSRNQGIKNSKGDIIAFLDDDAVADKDWLKEANRTFNENQRIGMVTGDISPLWKFENYNWFPKEMYWVISCSYSMTPRIKQEVRNGFGTNLFIKKELFSKVGLFEENFGYKGEKIKDSDEVELAIRILDKTDKKIIFNPKVKMNHKVYPFRTSMSYIIKKSYGDGEAKILLKKIHKNKQILSTENDYLKKLLFEFYPKAILRFFYKPLTSIRQIFAVSIMIFFVGLGFLKGWLK